MRLDVVPNDVPRRIVGVVADAAAGPLARDPAPTIYIPHLQQSRLWPVQGRGLRSGIYVVLRSRETLATMAPLITAAVAEVDANTPVADLS